LDKAKDESEEIILHAKKHSETILHEWESTAKKRSKAILDEWDNKVKHLLAQAQKDIKKLEESLVKNRTDSLKSTSKLLVKKILGNDKKLQDKYLDTLIDDLKK
jgi:F0F1-type ATP synthase membrane subunit b/b'